MSNKKTAGPQRVVDDCNALARTFYRMLGYQVEEGYKFHEARHPQERGMWSMAVVAYEHIDGVEVDECLAELEEES